MDILTLGLGLGLGLGRVLGLELGRQDVPGLKNTGMNFLASGRSRQDVVDPSARALRSDSRTCFGRHLYLAGRCCKNPQSARGPTQCKSGPEIACLVSVIIYCSIFQ